MRTHRDTLRGTYHQVLREIARHLLGPDSRGEPRGAHIKAVKELYRAKFHHGTSTEDMSDEQLSDLINTVEADAAEKGVTFPARRTRDAARMAAQPGA